MTLIDEDVFNRHIYRSETLSIKAVDAKVGDVIVIQKRAYEIYSIIPVTGGILKGDLVFIFKQGVSLQCSSDATQDKYIG